MISDEVVFFKHMNSNLHFALNLFFWGEGGSSPNVEISQTELIFTYVPIYFSNSYFTCYVSYFKIKLLEVSLHFKAPSTYRRRGLVLHDEHVALEPEVAFSERRLLLVRQVHVVLKQTSAHVVDNSVAIVYIV